MVKWLLSDTTEGQVVKNQHLPYHIAPLQSEIKQEKFPLAKRGGIHNSMDQTIYCFRILYLKTPCSVCTTNR